MTESKVVDVDKDMHDFMDVQKALEQHYEEKKLQILVCGKTGIGKSSLLNTLFGSELFKIGGPGETEDFNFDSVTSEVSSECINMQNVFLEIFDSPGLQDGTENDDRYIDDMQNKCGDVSLVLYCIDMMITRWSPQDMKATKLLTERFGVGFWKKTILVLTKANMLKPKSEGTDEKAFCKRAYSSFLQKFQRQLTEQGVHESIVSNIPAVAAGSDGDRYLPYVSSAANEDDTEGCQDFLPELWVTCVERMSGNSRFNFLKVTDYANRIKVNKERLSRAQRELLDEAEQQYKEKEKALEENERKLNEKIAHLDTHYKQEIEKLQQEWKIKFKEAADKAAKQQPQIIEVTRVIRTGSCVVL